MDSRVVRLRKAMHYADIHGLTRQDRHDLAETILRRDVRSWAELDAGQLERLLDAFEGHALLAHLLAGRVAEQVDDRLATHGGGR